MHEDKLFKKKNKHPRKIALKLNEDDDYEYLEIKNPYKKFYDSSNGGTSTVGVVDGDSSETKSPVDTTAVRNNYWLDAAQGSGRRINCAIMTTTKGKLQESLRVLEILTERDVIVVPSKNPPTADPNAGMQDPNAAPGGDPNAGMVDPNAPMGDPNAGMMDPNAAMGGDQNAATGDPNIAALMQVLQQSPDPETVEAVKKYAEGIIKAKMGDAQNAPSAVPQQGVDPNAAAAPPQQMESRQRNIDEIISDYLEDSDKRNNMPTVSKNLGSNNKSALKTKMFQPLQ
jgi:hypothetical protein